MKEGNINYGIIPQPPVTAASVPVDLTAATMKEHKNKILDRMREQNYDALVIYADREHGTNYGYLTGFEPRFEESLLVLHRDGKAYLMLGNESLKMDQYARLPVVGIHVPHFSLPNQPMRTSRTWLELLEQTGIRPGMRIGAVGWKLFTGKLEDNSQMFDLPYYILDGIKRLCQESGCVSNATRLFIDPAYGVRIQMNANEIAHYEYGASLAGHCIYRTLNELAEGKTELELADHLAVDGQPFSVQTICATGERYTNAVVSPRNKAVQVGDRVTMTMGLRGGLTHRCGYAVSCTEQMPEKEKDYLEKVAKPYYRALVVWYSHVGIGVNAGKLYEQIERTIPRSAYGWELNPGHYTAGEEWMSSPFYENSPVLLKSGMLLQMDIIIEVDGYGSANAEDGIALADEELRKELRETYPDVWERIQSRQAYMRDILHIPVRDEVLPMSGLCGYFRPYMLDKERALYL